MNTESKAFYQENKKSLWVYLGLSIITLSLYTVYYQYKTAKTLSLHRIDTDGILMKIWFSYIGLSVVSILCTILSDYDGDALNNIARVLNLIITITMFLFSRKAALLSKEHMAKEAGVYVTYNPVMMYAFPGMMLCSFMNNVDDAVKCSRDFALRNKA